MTDQSCYKNTFLIDCKVYRLQGTIKHKHYLFEDSQAILRIHYCGFGAFCSTGTKLMLSISNGTHIFHISIKRLLNKAI